MAKTAAPKSPITIAAEKARDALKTAKERDEKGSNTTTQQAVSHAKEVLRAAEKAENRQRFQTIAGGRVGKIIAAVETLRQVTNRKSFEFNANDWASAKAAINAKIAEIDKSFEIALASAPVAADKKAPAAFKFE